MPHTTGKQYASRPGHVRPTLGEERMKKMERIVKVAGMRKKKGKPYNMPRSMSKKMEY